MWLLLDEMEDRYGTGAYSAAMALDPEAARAAIKRHTEESPPVLEALARDAGMNDVAGLHGTLEGVALRAACSRYSRDEMEQFLRLLKRMEGYQPLTLVLGEGMTPVTMDRLMMEWNAAHPDADPIKRPI